MEISPEYSLEGLMLMIKLQYFGHVMWRGNSLAKTLMLRKIKVRRRRRWQRMRWMASLTQWTWVWADSGKDREAWCVAVRGVTKNYIRLSNWTTSSSFPTTLLSPPPPPGGLLGPHTHILLNSVSQLCLTLCDPMDCSRPGFPVHHQLPGLTQTHVHPVGDSIQSSHPLSSPSPPAFNLSQHQGLL